MLRSIQAVQVSLPDCTVQSTFVGPPSHLAERKGALPVIMLHGFDGSCIEFRRVKPYLDDQGVEAYAVDLLGNGFCASGLEGNSQADLGPEQRREHLYAFWKLQVGRPVVIVGISLGGAAALDFALAHPEAVEKLVLLAPQAMTDGIGPLASLPPFAARLGLKVPPPPSLGLKALRTFWLRDTAGKMGYFDKDRLATKDAVRVGRVHTFKPGWLDASAAFMRSGGYRVSKKIAEVQQDTTVVWGAKDEVLKPEDAQEFVRLLPHARLVMVEECGHQMHLEKPKRVAEVIVEAMGLSFNERQMESAVAGVSQQ